MQPGAGFDDPCGCANSGCSVQTKLSFWFFFGVFFFLFFSSFDRVLGPGVCFGIALIVVLGLQSSTFV